MKTTFPSLRTHSRMPWSGAGISYPAPVRRFVALFLERLHPEGRQVHVEEELQAGVIFTSSSSSRIAT
ncbi:MAG: hypothetical protein ACRDTR_01865 [Rubrobacter sp.]